MHRILHALLVAFVLASPLTAGTGRAQDRSADATAVRTVVARYVEARERRDATALAALFTDDADQLVSTGEWRRGREAVVAGGLASSARSAGVRTIDIEAVRFAGSDVAVADGRYEIAAAPATAANAASGAPTSGTAAAGPRRMWTTFVLVRQAGAWRISAIRNMRPTE
jgi:uncharacterized protein (TIGR02246 family)